MSSEATYFPKTLLEGPSDKHSESRPHGRHSSEGIGEADQLYAAELTESELIKQVKQRSKDALALLFRRYAPRVRNVAYRILHDWSEADDIVQEVFLYIFQRAALFDPTKGTPASWIVQIAYHRAINRRQYLSIRNHYQTKELEPDLVAVARSNPSIDEISARKLLNQLRGQLSGEQWRTLELHYFEGYSLREIAEKTGETLGNTRHYFYRALQRLRASVFPEKGA